MLDDKDIDAVVIATPNHWHALATIWALQAGKHVYVEKPSSHTVWEGRKMVEATARYNKIVQVGTMNRSRPAVRDAIKFIHEGGLGKVYMARGLCYKPRPAIGKYPDGPMAPGEKYALTVDLHDRTSRPTTRSTCRRSTTTCGSGRRRSGRSTATASTTTGTGTGTTATATAATRGRTSSTSRAGACRSRSTRSRSDRSAATSATSRRRKRRTCRPALFEYADGTILEFGTRGGFTNDEGSVKIGNLFYGTKGWLWIEEAGKKWQSYFGPEEREGARARTRPTRTPSRPA